MHTARRPAGDRGLCPGYHPSPIDHRRSGPPRSVPLTQHRAGTNPHQAYPTFFLWMGCNEPNHRTSGGEGTRGYQGTGSWQEGRYLGRFIAGRGGVRACTFQDSGQFLLPCVLRQYTSEPISKQKWRAEFQGGSGPWLIEQVVRFRFYFDR